MSRSTYPEDYEENEEDESEHEFLSLLDEEEEENAENDMDIFSDSEELFEDNEPETDLYHSAPRHIDDGDLFSDDIDKIPLEEWKRICINCRHPLTLQQQRTLSTRPYIRCISCGHVIKPTHSEKSQKRNKSLPSDFSPFGGQ